MAKKASKKEAQYQQRPYRGDKCADCTMFRAPKGCTAVTGVVAPTGWCKYFEAKTEQHLDEGGPVQPQPTGGPDTSSAPVGPPMDISPPPQQSDVEPGNKIPDQRDMYDKWSKDFNALPEGLHTGWDPGQGPPVQNISGAADKFNDTRARTHIEEGMPVKDYAQGGKVEGEDEWMHIVHHPEHYFGEGGEVDDELPEELQVLPEHLQGPAEDHYEPNHADWAAEPQPQQEASNQHSTYDSPTYDDGEPEHTPDTHLTDNQPTGSTEQPQPSRSASNDEPSTAGALARTAARAFGVSAESLPAIGAGAAIGTGVAGPIGGLVGGLAAGVAQGYFGGKYLVQARDWAADMLGLDSPEQRAADTEKNKEHPGLAMGAEIAGAVPTLFSPGAAGASAISRLGNRAVIGGSMGALNAGQQALEKGDVDWREAAANAAAGAVFAKPNRLGGALMGAGERLGAAMVPGRPNLTHPTAAEDIHEATDGTSEDIKASKGVAQEQSAPREDRDQPAATISVVADRGNTGVWAKRAQLREAAGLTEGQIDPPIVSALKEALADTRGGSKDESSAVPEDRLAKATAGTPPEPQGRTFEEPLRPGEFGQRSNADVNPDDAIEAMQRTPDSKVTNRLSADPRAGEVPEEPIPGAQEPPEKGLAPEAPATTNFGKRTPVPPSGDPTVDRLMQHPNVQKALADTTGSLVVRGNRVPYAAGALNDGSGRFAVDKSVPDFANVKRANGEGTVKLPLTKLYGIHENIETEYIKEQSAKLGREPTEQEKARFYDEGHKIARGVEESIVRAAGGDVADYNRIGDHIEALAREPVRPGETTPPNLFRDPYAGDPKNQQVLNQHGGGPDQAKLQSLLRQAQQQLPQMERAAADPHFPQETRDHYAKQAEGLRQGIAKYQAQLGTNPQPIGRTSNSPNLVQQGQTQNPAAARIQAISQGRSINPAGATPSRAGQPPILPPGRVPPAAPPGGKPPGGPVKPPTPSWDPRGELNWETSVINPLRQDRIDQNRKGMAFIATDINKPSQAENIGRNWLDRRKLLENERTKAVYEAHELVNKEKIFANAKNDEDAYFARESGTMANQPKAIQDAAARSTDRLNKVAEMFYKAAQEIDPSIGGQEVGNHVRRVAVGYNKYLDAILGEDTILSKATNKAAQFYTGRKNENAERTFAALEGPNGQRKVIGVHADDNGFTEWNKYKPTVIHDPNFEYKIGSTYTDKQGVKWNVVDAKTREIEQHAQNGAGKPMQYVHSDRYSAIINYLEAREAYKNAKDIRDLKEDPAVAPFLFKANQNIPGAVRLNAPQFFGMSAHPDLARSINAYKRPGLPADSLERVRNITNWATRTMFWNPIPHALNESVHGFEKVIGDMLSTGEFLNPMKWGGLLHDISKAVGEIRNPGDIVREMLDNGASLLSHDVRANQRAAALHAEIGKNYMQRNPQLVASMAKTLGMKPVELVNGIYNHSSRLMWELGDINRIVSYLQSRRRGANPERAIYETNKYLPTYRLPDQIFGSELLKQLSSEPAIAAFGRYHHAIMNTYAQHVKDMIGPESNMASRKDAAGKLMALGLLGMVVYPYMLNPFAKWATGNDKAEFKPRGPLTLPTNLYKFSKGQREGGIFDALSEMFMPTSTARAAWQTVTNKNWRGDDILEPQTQRDMVSKKAPGAWIKGAGAEISNIGKNMISPIGTIQQHYHAKRGVGGALLDEVGNFSEQSPKSSAWHREQAMKAKQKQMKREHKTDDLIERGFNAVGNGLNSLFGQ